MHWARLGVGFVLVGGLVLSPGFSAAQSADGTCDAARRVPIGTIALRGVETGPIEGDAGPQLPVTVYEFALEQTRDEPATTRYDPVLVRRPVDAATPTLADAFANEEELSNVVLSIGDAAGEPLVTYRFGIAELASYKTSGSDGCEFEEFALEVGAVSITHEPSGASVLDSGMNLRQ